MEFTELSTDTIYTWFNFYFRKTMETIDLIGYKREDLGKKYSKKLRAEGSVPCVLYGKDENKHFHTPMILFRELIYTPEVKFVNMDIEGEEHLCILQDAQFHPVSETILHADFLALQDDKKVKMDIPIKFTGTSPGIQQGGKLSQKLRSIKVEALPKDMPDVITVDITGLVLGKSVKIGDLPEADYTILNSPLVTIGSVTIPRSLRSAQSKGEGEDEE